MAGSKDVVLVCEDTAHKAFVYSCLSKLGVEDLKWHVVSYVASLKRHGGNRDDVIERLNRTEFDSWESRCARHKVLLVAVIDADGDSLTAARSLLPTSTLYGDLFAVVIPRRNIQTWVELSRDGASATSPDEEADYKRTATKSDKSAKNAAKMLLSWYQDAPPDAIAENPVWKTFAKQMSELKQAIGVWKAS